MSSVVDSVGSMLYGYSRVYLCTQDVPYGGYGSVRGIGPGVGSGWDDGGMGTVPGTRYPVLLRLLSLLSPSLTHPLLCSSMQSAGCRVLAI